jgi:pimeloyl-ACP methyl ester carboxylesterase
MDWSAVVRDARLAGRRVRYADHGNGPALVLIHGLGGSWQTWLNNIPALGLRHRVIAIDLPGFGGSDVLPPPAEMRGHAETVAALLDELGIASATVVAHSMGGIVALSLIAARPELVDGLVLANAGGIPLTPLRLALIVGGFRLFDRFLNRPAVMHAVAVRPRLRRLAFAGFIFDHETLRGPFAAEVVPAMSAPGFLGAVVAAGKVAAAVDPSTVRCPVLLLWGRHDRILPLEHARELARVLPDARLVVIERAGHCPMFEAPEEFNGAVLEFAGVTV